MFAKVIPERTPAGTVRHGGPLYLRHGAGLVSAAGAFGWQFVSKDQRNPRSIHDSFDPPPCRFTQAFTWQNSRAARELCGLRGEILRVMGKNDEAVVAEQYAKGDALAAPCTRAP